MVCPRCISTVEQIFGQSGIPVLHVALGEVAFETMPDEASLDEVKRKLADAGFEVIETRLHKLVDDIRRLIAQYLTDIGKQKTNLSAFITASIPYDYSYLSDVFSSVEGKSIEQYFILLRIEKSRSYWCMTNFRSPKSHSNLVSAASITCLRNSRKSPG